MKIIRVVDLETTGDAPPEHSVCEIGFCDIESTATDLAGSPSAWVVRGGFGVFVNPGRPIPPETSAIHHIIDSDVASAPRWDDVRSDYVSNEWLEVDQPPIIALAAHSASFERKFITDEDTGGLNWICTYKCALRLFPDAPGHSNQVLRYWLSPISLDRTVANVAHRAYPDAYVTAFTLRALLELAPVEDLIKWSSEPALLRRVPFGKNRGALWTEIDDGLLWWVLDKDFGEDILFTARKEIERREKEREEQSLNQDVANQ